jgi:hypothetical protein
MSDMKTITMNLDEIVGDPNAPEGTVARAAGLRWMLLDMLKSHGQDMMGLNSRIRQFKTEECWKLLTDENDRPFRSFAHFCTTPYPLGLGLPVAILEKIAKEAKEYMAWKDTLKGTTAALPQGTNRHTSSRPAGGRSSGGEKKYGGNNATATAAAINRDAADPSAKKHEGAVAAIEGTEKGEIKSAAQAKRVHNGQPPKEKKKPIKVEAVQQPTLFRPSLEVVAAGLLADAQAKNVNGLELLIKVLEAQTEYGQELGPLLLQRCKDILVSKRPRSVLG